CARGGRPAGWTSPCRPPPPAPMSRSASPVLRSLCARRREGAGEQARHQAELDEADQRHDHAQPARLVALHPAEPFAADQQPEDQDERAGQAEEADHVKALLRQRFPPGRRLRALDTVRLAHRRPIWRASSPLSMATLWAPAAISASGW